MVTNFGIQEAEGYKETLTQEIATKFSEDQAIAFANFLSHTDIGGKTVEKLYEEFNSLYEV